MADQDVGETKGMLFVKKDLNPILKEWENYAGFLGYQVEVTSPTGKMSGLTADIES